jgi:hypothetical protein
VGVESVVLQFKLQKTFSAVQKWSVECGLGPVEIFPVSDLVSSSISCMGQGGYHVLGILPPRLVKGLNCRLVLKRSLTLSVNRPVSPVFKWFLIGFIAFSNSGLFF